MSNMLLYNFVLAELGLEPGPDVSNVNAFRNLSQQSCLNKPHF